MRNRTPLRVVALGCAAFLAVFAIVWYSVLQLIAIRPDTGPIRPVLSGISAFFLSAALLGNWGFIRGHHRAMQPVNLGESDALMTAHPADSTHTDAAMKAPKRGARRRRGRDLATIRLRL